MADTEYHDPPEGTIFDELPLDEIDWRTVDRLIVLMSLTVTLRLLRRKRGIRMGERVKFLIMNRMRKLIDAYKRPDPRGRKHGR